MVSVSNNTSIWVLSMIPLPVFSVWISTSFSREQAAELVSEEDANPPSEQNTESPKTKLWNGSEENSMELSTTDSFTYLNNPQLFVFMIRKYFQIKIVFS